MVKFEKLEKLSAESEEYQMLMDVAKKLETSEKISTKDSGKATQLVLCKYLFEKGFRVLNSSEVKIVEVKTKMNLLYLIKEGVDCNGREYSVKDVEAVLKIVNNAVGEDYKETIKDTFNKFRDLNESIRFATIVLSENNAAPKPYEHSLKQIDFEDPLFTLIVRKKSAFELYRKETVIQLHQKGEMRKPESGGLQNLLQ
jgi:hypothetical protein